MGDRNKKKNRSYMQLNVDFLRSDPFLALEPAARVILLGFMFKFNGKNQGQIYYATKHLQGDLNIRPNPACDGVNRLIEMGFLTVTREFHFDKGQRRARTFQVHLVPDNTKRINGRSVGAGGAQIAWLSRVDKRYKGYADEHMKLKHRTVRFYKAVHDSEEYRRLPTNAKAVLIDMVADITGDNNGRLPYSEAKAAKHVGISKSTARRMLKILEEAQFIVCRRNLGFNKIKAAKEWELTFLPDFRGNPASWAWNTLEPKKPGKTREFEMKDMALL